jgi:hypothetical protein
MGPEVFLSVIINENKVTGIMRQLAHPVIMTTVALAKRVLFDSYEKWFFQV